MLVIDKNVVYVLCLELAPEMVQTLKDGASLAAGIAHENPMPEIAPVADNVRQSLLGDLD